MFFITTALGIGYDSPNAIDLKLLNVAAIVTTVLLKLMLSLQVQWEICIRKFDLRTKRDNSKLTYKQNQIQIQLC